MFKLVSLVLAVGAAQAGVIPAALVRTAPVVAHAPVVVGATASQYHSQDELGQYAYGYAGGPSAKEEIRTADGITRGGYSYVDGHGLVQSAQYVSDPVNGFRVAATNLPVGPVVPDGPEEVEVAVAPAPVAVVPAPVAVAPAPVAVAPAPVAIAPAPVAIAPAPVAIAPAPVAIAPAPVAIAAAPAAIVEDDDSTIVESVQLGETPEVANARAAHLAAVEQTKLRDALQESADAAEAAAAAVVPVAPVVAAAPAVVAAPAPVIAPAPVLAPTIVKTAPVLAAAPVVAAPVVAAAHVVAAAPVVVGATASQYHSQDELGQYAYGYAGGPSAKDEIHTADGVTRGGYSYLDAHGLVQSAQYVSDPHNGFRVAATNLPVQPGPVYLADTAEVAEAKAKLFQAQAEHIAKL